tara:strand:- start:3066 stop:5126 length:2061 start_codon:yes stop_codon:yes gene_type:complete
MALSNLELGDIALYIVGSKNRWVPLRWYTGIVGGSNVVSTFSKFSLLTNVIGFNPGIPSITIDGPDDGKIEMGYLKGIPLDTQGNQTRGIIRHMISSGWSLGEYANMFFIVYGGNYRVINWCDNTTIYKNGSSQGTVTNAGTVTNVNSLSVGDRIECDKPFSLYYNGLPGLYGAYAGFSGYGFATRNDRESSTNGNKFYIFCTDYEPDVTGGAFFQVRYTTTSNSNVTSTTVDLDDEWNAAYDEYNTNMVSGGRAYFAGSNVLMCAWRGRSTGSSLYDSVPMYPLTPEPKYGWYSQGGHILACAGPYQTRDGSTSNYQVKTRTASTSTTEFSLSTSVEKWARNDSNTGANTASKFAGSPAVTFSDPTGSEGQGALFAAESQGDGDGTEMTPHVGSNAASSFHCNPGGGNWQVHMSLFTGSAGGGVVQRFNSSRTFVESYALGNSTNGFSNTTSHAFASCRFTNLNAGDVFITTPARGGGHSQSLAWADMDSSDDDETYLPAGEDMDGFSFTSYTVYYDEEESSFLATSALNACNLEDNTITMYSLSSTLQAGMVMYLQNTDVLTPLNVITGASARAENGYLKVVDGRDSYALEFGAFSNGRVESVTACISDRRLKKNITKVGTSPSGINIYRFEYIDSKLYGGGVFEGVMAQEVPKASILGKNGYYSVDYTKTDVTFKRIDYSLVN